MTTQFKVRIPFILYSFIHVIVVSCLQGPQTADKWFRTLNKEPKTAVIEVYGQVVLAGPRQNSYEIARASITSTSPTSFGLLLMVDLLFTEGPDPSSQEVGRGQGLIGYADLDEPVLFYSGTAVFNRGPYSGSTVSVLGLDQLQKDAREIPIVGGTGAFRLARGILVSTTIVDINATSYGTFKYTFYVIYYGI